MKRYLNKEVIKFALSALIIYLVWYLLYDQWILPDGRVDYWLSHNIAMVSGGLLHLVGYHVFAYGRIVGISGAPGILMKNGCNGLSAIGLFLGFIIAFPGDKWNRLLFSIAGILVIYVTNVVRIVFLAVLQLLGPSYFNFAHKYSTTGVFYLVIFILWVIWVNTGGRREDMSHVLKPVA